MDILHDSNKHHSSTNSQTLEKYTSISSCITLKISCKYYFDDSSTEVSQMLGLSFIPLWKLLRRTNTYWCILYARPWAWQHTTINTVIEQEQKLLSQPGTICSPKSRTHNMQFGDTAGPHVISSLPWIWSLNPFNPRDKRGFTLAHAMLKSITSSRPKNFTLKHWRLRLPINHEAASKRDSITTFLHCLKSRIPLVN